MSIWINGKSLMKYHCLKKKNFIATYIWKILHMQITCMQKEFAKTLKSKLQVNIMIFILKVIHYFWLTFFKMLGKCVLKVCHLDTVEFLSTLELA